jgi:hypothetical protein
MRIPTELIAQDGGGARARPSELWPTSGDDAITWFDLKIEHGPLAVANWSHVEHGRIARVRAAFDPRALLG